MNIATIKQSLRIEEVIARYVPLTRKGGWYVGRCPFHDDTNPSLVVWPRTQTWKCMTCSPMRDDVVGFVARMEGVSLREALQRLSAAVPDTSVREPVWQRSSQTVASGPDRHATYTALLARWGLAARHRLALYARGLTDATIAGAGLATVRPGWSPVTPAADGIPGFARVGDRWKVLGPAGLAIPVRNAYGQIVAVHVRADDPTGGKYRWLSSGSHPGGAASGTPAHVVPGAGSVVWVTEGPLKAIVAGQFLGVPVIGVPGVSTWSTALEPLTALKPTRVVIAFDQDPDPATAEQVSQHVSRLGAALAQQGIPWSRAVWSGPKGLDDAVVAGTAITVIEHGGSPPDFGYRGHTPSVTIEKKEG